MSVGFRKSLFGFNCDDVCEYIQNTHKSFVEKETVLKEQVDSLSNDLTKMQESIKELKEEKAKIEVELKKYTDKYDEIERLSQNIGKLYLVSKANAQSVIDSAEESKKIAENEVGKNINLVDDAQTSLSSIKEEINKTSAQFTAKLNELMASLENTKSTLNSSIIAREKKIEEVKEIFESVNS